MQSAATPAQSTSVRPPARTGAVGVYALADGPVGDATTAAVESAGAAAEVLEHEQPARRQGGLATAYTGAGYGQDARHERGPHPNGGAVRRGAGVAAHPTAGTATYPFE